ncbi:hypothetical protein DFH09DRAFT_884517, partial [Mycena vulgaris]
HDLLIWALDESPVSLTVHILDSESDSGQLIRFTIEEYWVDSCLRLGNRVNDICIALADKYEFYRVGDVPSKASEDDLRDSFETEEDARHAAAGARRAVLDQLGLVAWFMTVSWDYAVGLSDEMTQFLIDLRLGERRKRGCLFSLSRDWKYMNIVHLIRHNVPFHYPWTEAEENDRRFLMYSQAFL